MREKQKCRRYCSWNLEDLSDVERFLEKKAEEGWIVEKHWEGWFTFRKDKPRKTRYFVEVFEKDKWNNSVENVVNQEFLKACEKKGWKFVCADSRFQILSCENPCEKKPTLLKTGKINSIYKSYFIEQNYLLLCLLFMSLFNMFFGFNGTVQLLTSLSQLLYVSAWMLLAIYLVAYMVCQKRWHAKALSATRRDRAIPKNPRRAFAYGGCICSIVFLLASIAGFFIESRTYSSGRAFTRCVILLVVVVAIFVTRLAKNQKVTWKVAGGMCAAAVAVVVGIYASAYQFSPIFEEVHKTKTYEATIVYEDPLPITLEQLGIEKGKDVVYSNYHQVTGEFLIKQDYYSEEPAGKTQQDAPSFSYIVYQSENASLYDKVLEEECFAKNDRSSYEEVEGSNANKLYKKKLDSGYYEYIFAFDTQIIKMNINVELNMEQLKKIQMV